MLKHILLGRGEGEEGSRREKSINILELWISHLRGALGLCPCELWVAVIKLALLVQK